MGLEPRQLIEHMKTFPTRLPPELLAVAKEERGLTLNGGDFILLEKPSSTLFFESLYPKGYGANRAVLLTTPSVRFAYDSSTGEEIASNLDGYEIGRTQVLPGFIDMLRHDSLNLRAKGLGGLARGQDLFIEELCKY